MAERDDYKEPLVFFGRTCVWMPYIENNFIQSLDKNFVRENKEM